MKSEIEYLLAGLEESHCVVLVVGFEREGSLRRRMTYISPNAKSMGINPKALTSGFKLPEDYIHIEDRAAFVEAVAKARRENQNIGYQVRIIGDDGVVRSVDLSIKIINASEEDAEIIFFVRERDSMPLEEVLKAMELEYPLTTEYFEKSEAKSLFTALSRELGIYSAIVDMDGHPVAPPCGPDAYIGMFYDMFERPEYHELFNNMLESTNRGVFEGARLVPMDDRHPNGRITAYPIAIKGKTIGIWLLAAYTDEEVEILIDSDASMQHAINVLTDYTKRYYLSEDKIDGRNAAKKRIEFEISRHRILEGCLYRLNDDRTKAFNRCFEDVGKLFETSFVGSFRYRHGQLVLTAYWAERPDDQEEIDKYTDIGTVTTTFEKEEKEKFEKEGLIIDNSNATNRMRVTMLKGMARAMILIPVFVRDNCVGHIAVIEKKRERVWKEEEIDFVRGVAYVFGTTQELTDVEIKMAKSNNSMLEVLNYIGASVFIKDFSSNKILFATDSLNEMVGKDLTGMDSRMLIPDDYDKLSLMGMKGKIHKSGSKKQWQRYMDIFNDTVNITEVDINWHGGAPAVLYILKKNGEMEIV